MLSILNKLILKKELLHFVTKSQNTTTKQKIKHENPCPSRELNPAPVAPQADALPLHHQVN